MLVRRNRWGLSWRGRLWVLLLLGLAAVVVVRGAYRFLAVTAREPVGVLVVEGWVHEYAIRAAAAELETEGYNCIYSTGGPVTGNGGYTTDLTTSASVGAGLLRKVGVPAERVKMIPSHNIDRDRTYQSAVALRDWFREHEMDVRQLNVVTEGAHARRTRLLFQKAFGDDVAIGIIAIPNPDYDGGRWWRYSEGVREVVGETLAYLYVRLFFHPAEPVGDS